PARANQARAQIGENVVGDTNREWLGLRGAHRRLLLTNAATAPPISAGESSWMKWLPFTVTSSWFGQRRQNSRCAPVRIVPGSALTKSLGTALSESQRA